MCRKQFTMVVNIDVVLNVLDWCYLVTSYQMHLLSAQESGDTSRLFRVT